MACQKTSSECNQGPALLYPTEQYPQWQIFALAWRYVFKLKINFCQLKWRVNIEYTKERFMSTAHNVGWADDLLLMWKFKAKATLTTVDENSYVPTML